VVMVMEMVQTVGVDQQGRVVIPKELRERKKLQGEIEIIEVNEGLLLRPLRREWNKIFDNKAKVNWHKALAVSLESISIDDLLFGGS